MKNSILVFLLCLVSIMGKSQDASHYTFYQLAPLQLNPGLIGAFEGTFRVGGLFRGQLYGGTKGYTQPTFAIDAPVIRGFRELDWVGIGISTDIVNTAGELGAKLGGSSLGVSYHFALDKKRERVFSIGIQYGSYGFNFGANDQPILGENIVTGMFDVIPADATGFFIQDPQSGQYQGGQSGGNMNVGLTYRALLNKTSSFEGGVMLAHLLAPFTSVTGQRANRAGRRVAAYGKLTNYISKNLRIEPSLFAQVMSGFTSIQVQCMAGLLMDPKKNIVVNAGLGYRVEGSAAEFLIGVEQGNLRAGLSFDLNMGSIAQAPGLQNAFEFGFGYIFKISKKPDVKPIIFCPRL